MSASSELILFLNKVSVLKWFIGKDKLNEKRNINLLLT
jgi:hypothetical protein